MSLTEFEYILKEVKQITNYIYLHVKGEPLLHSRFNDILTICDKHQMQVNITTNGTLLLKQTETIISHDCVRQINISLNSDETKNNEKYLTGVLNASKTIQENKNIYIVYRLWAQSTNTLSSKDQTTVENIIKYYELTPSLKNDVINTKNIKLKEKLYINKEEFFDWPNLNLPYQGTIGNCHGLKDHIAILVDGTVIPCCLDSDGIINLGNIFETNLQDVLNGTRAQNILKGYQNNQIVEELCQKCTYRLRFSKNKKNEKQNQC